MYKYLMIEDNPAAVELLQLLMEDYDEFQPTVVSCDLKEGVRGVLAHKPDLLFLDVELPGFSGFDFVKTLRKYLQELPCIIMMTAHEKYALPAVNEEIFYYLLKPLDPDELLAALTKFKIKKSKEQKSIAIKTNKGYSFLNFNEILFIKSSSNYTYFYTTDLRREVVSKTMKEFEAYLGDQFLRVHKSYIVNTTYVELFMTARKKLQMLITTPLKISTKQQQDALELFDLITSEGNLEIPIGEAFFEKVKHSILYNKLS